MSHVLIPAAGAERLLVEELRRMWPESRPMCDASGLVRCDFPLWQRQEDARQIVFTRQLLPNAMEQEIPSINGWSSQLLAAALEQLPPEKPWRLHLAPRYGEGRAGVNRCGLIRDAILARLKQKRRSLLRVLEESEAPFTAETSLLQLLLTAPNRGFVSAAPAPMPFALRAVVSPALQGDIPWAVDKAAPSRAFAKLLEAEQRLGRAIQRGDICVDLGASPGSWSYVALNRGAHVIAVDRSPLREDLMRNARLEFVRGDAFKFSPPGAADWLLCDVIAEPHRSIALVTEWAREKRCRHFVVTIKFKGGEDYGLLEGLKAALNPLCCDFILTHLCANKNEACAIGTVMP